MRWKPTLAQLGVDLEALDWQRSGTGPGSFEIALVAETGRDPASADDRSGVKWILLRVAGDPDGRVLIYDRIEWESFLHGVKHGEFDDGA
ncbi:MAG: DUF397 domain-containing protein [Streptosporangiaceae bacterium]